MSRLLLSVSIHLTIAIPLLPSSFLKPTTQRSNRVSNRPFLGAFAKPRKTPIASSLLSLTDRPSFCLSDCRHVSGRLSLKGCPKNLILEIFIEISREMPDSLKIGQNYQALRVQV